MQGIAIGFVLSQLAPPTDEFAATVHLCSFHRSFGLVKRNLAMDLEDRLKQLQSLYCYAASAASADKIRYLGLLGSAQASAKQIAQAKQAWQESETRKVTVIANMVELDQRELTATR
jgi:hypothetical protein